MHSHLHHRHGPGGPRLGRHPFGFHERPHRRGRAGRMFEGGDLRLVLLALIAEKPAHGYELIRDVEERFGGAYSPSPGVVYPTLTLLEELGLVGVSAEERGRKLFRVTEAGQAHLAERRAEVERLLERMREAGARSGRPAPAVLRALEGLSTALRHRLAEGPLAEEELRAVVEAIDLATARLEGR